MTDNQLKEKANQEWGNISKIAEAAYCDGYNYAKSLLQEERVNIADDRDKIIAAHIDGQLLASGVSNDDEAVLYFEENMEIGLLVQDINHISNIAYNSPDGNYTVFYTDGTVIKPMSRKLLIDFLKNA